MKSFYTQIVKTENQVGMRKQQVLVQCREKFLWEWTVGRVPKNS